MNHITKEIETMEKQTLEYFLRQLEKELDKKSLKDAYRERLSSLKLQVLEILSTDF